MIESKDKGRPFPVSGRRPIERNDLERQRPEILNLSDLNHPGRGPVNNPPHNGRRFPSRSRYLSREEFEKEQDEATDIL